MLGNRIIICAFLVFSIPACFQGFHEADARKRWGLELSSQKQDCGTGNSIDDCWRCHNSSWYQQRKRLSDCALGFGKNANGGEQGKQYVVTDNSDDPINPQPGTLRHAVIQYKPLWITFARDMVIHLEAELIMNSLKTIDGRGANIHITGFGCIVVKYVGHIIIHGIHIHDCKTGPPTRVMTRPDHLTFRDESDGDGITIFGARDVWVDHCSLWNCTDGLIDVVHNSTYVTISNSHFTHHDKVMLLGHSDDDTSEKILRVTVAYNRFGENLGQRMPRCRHGRFHVVNNHYSGWHKYAIGGTANPSILSQGNVYIAPDDKSKKEVTRRNNAYLHDDWMKWNWLSHGDELMNGAFFTQSGKRNLTNYKQVVSMEAKPSSEVIAITADAGVLECRQGRACLHN